MSKLKAIGCLVWLLLPAMGILSGCSNNSERPQVVIQGVVTVDDAPLDVGSIHFVSPVTGEIAYANLGEGGAYSVTFPQADLGEEYAVFLGTPVVDQSDASVVVEVPKMKVKLPKSHTDQRTSPLKVRVEKAGVNQYDVSVSSK